MEVVKLTRSGLERLLDKELMENKERITEAVQNEEVSSLARMKTMFNEAPVDEFGFQTVNKTQPLKYEKYMKEAERKMKVLNRQLTKDFDMDEDVNESFIIDQQDA